MRVDLRQDDVGRGTSIRMQSVVGSLDRGRHDVWQSFLGDVVERVLVAFRVTNRQRIRPL